jgi:hypothetical protein
LKVFISYSTGDNDIVNQLVCQIKPYCQVFFWDQDKALGEPAWGQIFNWIDQSDLVIALVTDKTVSRGISVGQEIGRAVTKRKLVIPLIARDVPEAELGCLKGVAHQRIDLNDPGLAIQKVENRIAALSRPKPILKPKQIPNQVPIDWKPVIFITGFIILIVWGLTSAEG